MNKFLDLASVGCVWLGAKDLGQRVFALLHTALISLRIASLYLINLCLDFIHDCIDLLFVVFWVHGVPIIVRHFLDGRIGLLIDLVLIDCFEVLGGCIVTSSCYVHDFTFSSQFVL